MGLDETAVGLGLQRRKLDLFWRHPQVDPGREVVHGHVRVALEHQLADDLLCPGRTRFGVGAHHDVAVAELEIVPDGRVHVMVHQLA